MGPCRGFEGDCADIIPQFESVQGPYVYGEPPEEHAYLDEYVCHQFPDEENYWDQILVGLISVAVALPIDIFLARAFEIANESDAPECWLDAPAGRVKLLIGKDAHRGWHLADPSAPVSDFVLWVVRYSGGEPLISSCFRALDWLVRRCRGKNSIEEDAEDAGGEEAPSGTASGGSADARADALTKRLYASLGLLGVYVCWCIFAWFIFVRVCRGCALCVAYAHCQTRLMLTRPSPHAVKNRPTEC